MGIWLEAWTCTLTGNLVISILKFHFKIQILIEMLSVSTGISIFLCLADILLPVVYIKYQPFHYHKSTNQAWILNQTLSVTIFSPNISKDNILYRWISSWNCLQKKWQIHRKTGWWQRGVNWFWSNHLSLEHYFSLYLPPPTYSITLLYPFQMAFLYLMKAYMHLCIYQQSNSVNFLE